jgi:putative FmdB family regulatory protein
MPTYDYACTKCGHTFEAVQSMKDAPFKKCPKCGKQSLKRLVGAGAGLIFKGTGFYITDYKKKSGQPEKSASGGEKPASGGADKKPASPAAAK